MLLQIDPGRAQEAAQYVAALDAVTDTVLTSGPYDVIATVQGSDAALSRTMAQARRTPGLCLLRSVPRELRRPSPRQRERRSG